MNHVKELYTRAVKYTKVCAVLSKYKPVEALLVLQIPHSSNQLINLAAVRESTIGCKSQRLPFDLLPATKSATN